MTDERPTLREHWNGSTITQRFEIAVSLCLYIVIALVACFSLLRLIMALGTMAFKPWDIGDLLGVQVIFGMVMTVLIALEFGHSLSRNLKNHEAIIHAKEVILIGLMAIVRKLIIIDMGEASAWTLLGLAAAILSLSLAYWLIERSREAVAGLNQ